MHEGDHVISIKNLSDLLFAYSAIAPVALNSKRQFLYDLEKAIYEKTILKDKFTTIDSTKILWALAKFENRHINPGFNRDVSSSILNRYSLSKVKSVSHRVPKALIFEILDRRKMQTNKNMSLGLYSLASMDFYD